jgi:hypothetical protein
MARAVEAFALIHFAVMGLSHLLHPGMWVDFFIMLRDRGRSGAMVHGFLSLGFGSIVAAFHPVWSGRAAVLTVLGWLYLVKAFMCFVVPASQARTLARVSHQRTLELRMVGAAYLAVGGWLGWLLLTP